MDQDMYVGLDNQSFEVGRYRRLQDDDKSKDTQSKECFRGAVAQVPRWRYRIIRLDNVAAESHSKEQSLNSSAVS